VKKKKENRSEKNKRKENNPGLGPKLGGQTRKKGGGRGEKIQKKKKSKLRHSRKRQGARTQIWEEVQKGENLQRVVNLSGRAEGNWGGGERGLPGRREERRVMRKKIPAGRRD